MPELPEIETIRLGLQRKIIGLKLRDIEILSPKTFQGQTDLLRGTKVLKVARYAKVLAIELTSNLTLLFHLKMTGQLIWAGKGEEGKGKRFVGGHPTLDMVGDLPNSSTRAVFTFSDGSKLYFNDQRRFGWIKVIENLKFKIENLLGHLGPEPLEKNFTWEVLKQNLLRHPSMPVKKALMDQSVVSGIGNIYANEACFDAKIDPRIKVKDLTDQDFESLHKGVTRSLQDGIKYGGATRAHFVDSDGHKGYFLDYAFVYGRDKHPCKICKTEIKKIQLGGRGTYFCERCQS